jgi:hypothetical protein
VTALGLPYGTGGRSARRTGLQLSRVAPSGSDVRITPERGSKCIEPDSLERRYATAPHPEGPWVKTHVYNRFSLREMGGRRPPLQLYAHEIPGVILQEHLSSRQSGLNPRPSIEELIAQKWFVAGGRRFGDHEFALLGEAD